jgi:hypothetical protein
MDDLVEPGQGRSRSVPVSTHDISDDLVRQYVMEGRAYSGIGYRSRRLGLDNSLDELYTAYADARGI